MLSLLVNTNIPWANNAWKLWVDHIMKQKSSLGFKKACLVYSTGAVASATPGFHLSSHDVQRINLAFNSGAPGDTIKLQDKTFVLKYVSPDLVIAFTGSNYFIVTKSKSMHIASLITCRSKYEEGARWLRKLNKRLIERDY